MPIVPGKAMERRTFLRGVGAVVALPYLDAMEPAFRSLAKVRGASRDEELHRARIAAKRLRYLVERAEQAVVGVPAMVRDLKQFQDLAGDAHDVHVFSRELRLLFRKYGARGRGALDVRLRQRGAKAYASVAQRWLGESSAGFFKRSATLTARLRR